MSGIKKLFWLQILVMIISFSTSRGNNEGDADLQQVAQQLNTNKPISKKPLLTQSQPDKNKPKKIIRGPDKSYVEADREWIENFPFEKTYSTNKFIRLPHTTLKTRKIQNKHNFLVNFYESRETKSKAFQKLYGILTEEGIKADSYFFGKLDTRLVNMAAIHELANSEDPFHKKAFPDGYDSKIKMYGDVTLREVADMYEKNLHKTFLNSEVWNNPQKEIQAEKAKRIAKRLLEEIPWELYRNLQGFALQSDSSLYGKYPLIN